MLQRIARQLEYRLIQRRIEAGEIGWAQWLEEEGHNHPGDDEEQQDQSKCSQDNVLAGQCPVSPGSVTMEQRIDGEEIHVADSVTAGGNFVPPADNLNFNGEELAAGCQIAGQHCIRQDEKVILSILLTFFILTLIFSNSSLHLF